MRVRLFLISMSVKTYQPKEFKIMPVRECAPTTELLDTPDRAASYWKSNIPGADWFDPAKEAFVVLVLNTRRRIIGHTLVTLGTLDACTVHPREVFRPAIVAAGSAIVLMHNHPSGDPTPSEADIRVTRDLIRAGHLLKIEVLDHVVMGKASVDQAKDYSSLKELGYFYAA
jgi:DNA repair protein RadC